MVLKACSIEPQLTAVRRPLFEEYEEDTASEAVNSDDEEEEEGQQTSMTHDGQSTALGLDPPTEEEKELIGSYLTLSGPQLFKLNLEVWTKKGKFRAKYKHLAQIADKPGVPTRTYAANNSSWASNATINGSTMRVSVVEDQGREHPSRIPFYNFQPYHLIGS